MGVHEESQEGWKLKTVANWEMKLEKMNFWSSELADCFKFLSHT